MARVRICRRVGSQEVPLYDIEVDCDCPPAVVVLAPDLNLTPEQVRARLESQYEAPAPDRERAQPRDDGTTDLLMQIAILS